MHSTASDGALAPAAVVAASRDAGLAAICLTDHDSVGGVAEARATGDALGVIVAAGTELSAHHEGRELHLLGLHLARLDVMEGHLAGFRDARDARGEAIVGQLNAIGIPVTIGAVRAEANGGALGRPHVARALIAGGWVGSVREAFDRYLAAGRPGYADKQRLDVERAIAIVHEAGGIAVFAHPGPDGRREKVEPLVAMGLDGLEVRHPSHANEDAMRLAALADFFGMVPSGGSDWHGVPGGSRQVGCMQVPWEWYERQLERAERHRAAGRSS
ncbi:MAG: PHP domain-containing protein [Gemmatimonadetes bacterium]|nr:PHP domain-containing protein [Gemmatimonadota bacterium]